MWHRRSGKDLTDLNIMIAEMALHVGNYYYFLPTYSQAKKVIWEGKTRDGTPFLDFFPPWNVESTNDSELKIKFKNGSLFQLIGTDNIDSVVGTNPIGCVFSEFSLQNPKAWDYIRPILAENGGWAIFNFTPRGRNHAWKILQQAKEFKWFNEVLGARDTDVIPEEVLAEEKKQMPQDLYRQEYFCEFLDNAGAVFRGVDDVVYEGTEVVTKDKLYQMGVDLAKHQDFTVITPFDLTSFKVLKPDRFNQIDYNLQKAKIEASYYHYNKAKTYLDSTGVGEPIFDDLQARQLGNVYPYQFTEASRKNLLINLQILIEQRKIKIPNDEILIGELKSFAYHLTEQGKVKMMVPEGLHDDCVMSLALAVWDIPDAPLKVKTQEQKDLLKQFDALRTRNQSDKTSVRYY